MVKALKIFGLIFLLFAVSFSYAGEKTIVIDIGHGGKDDGVEIDGFLEKDLTFEIAKKIQALNTDDKIKIIFTRESDDFVSLSERVEYINSLNPDFVISLHINSHDDSRVNGIDLFVSPQSSRNKESEIFAQRIEDSLSKEFSSNGINEANLYILKNINSPSATIELGYLSNLGDRNVLTSEYGQHRMAEAIYNVLK